MLESFLADIRYAVRWLRKSPGFTLVAVASLAIGIGFNTALFAIVDAVLFKPLPVAAPARLVDVFTSDSTGTSSSAPRPIPTTAISARSNDVFDGLVGYSPMFAALNLDGRSRLAMGEIVTGNYFQVFGVARRDRPHDSAGRRCPGRAARGDGVAPLLDARARLGARRRRPHAAHPRRSPTPSSASRRRAFNGMVPILAPEMWIPASSSLDVEPVGMHDAMPSPTGTTRLDRRADRWLFMRGRLKPGKTSTRRAPTWRVLMTRLAADNPRPTGSGTSRSSRPATCTFIRRSIRWWCRSPRR